MDARRRFWLNGLIAGLFALAVLPIPAQHARAMLERTAFIVAYAMPDGSLPEICSGRGGPVEHGKHLVSPACLACVLLAVPGLPPAPFLIGARVGGTAAAEHDGEAAAAVPRLARTPQSARGPPAGSIA